MHRQPTAIRLPPLARRGTPLRTDHPEPALSPEPRDRLTGTRTGTLSYRSRATMRIALTGGRKASIIGLPLASNAGGIGVREPALIGLAAEARSKRPAYDLPLLTHRLSVNTRAPLYAALVVDGRDACFVVRDRNAHALAYVNFEETSQVRSRTDVAV